MYLLSTYYVQRPRPLLLRGIEGRANTQSALTLTLTLTLNLTRTRTRTRTRARTQTQTQTRTQTRTRTLTRTLTRRVIDATDTDYRNDEMAIAQEVSVAPTCPSYYADYLY